jgi:hypothetical protein
MCSSLDVAGAAGDGEALPASQANVKLHERAFAAVRLVGRSLRSLDEITTDPQASLSRARFPKEAMHPQGTPALTK